MPSRSAGVPDSKSVDTTWLGLHEASVLLGVSLSTVRRWADSGKVPVYRTAGGHRRFRRQELQSLLAADITIAALSPSSPPSWPTDAQEMNQQEWHRKVTDLAVA